MRRTLPKVVSPRTEAGRRRARHRWGGGLETLERRELLATYQVGSGAPYPTLRSLPVLAPGDTVNIGPGIYKEAITWSAHGTAARPITIRGVGATRPIIDGTGVNVEGAAGPRALFQIQGDNYVIDNLEFRNAHNSSDNGAGLRILYASGVTIRNCKAVDNDMGLMSYDDDTLIEYSEFVHNGSPLDANQLAHNIYTEGRRTRIQYSYIHDAWIGQNVKSRSHYTELLYNFISDSNQGEVSLVDSTTMTASSNSNALLLGNVIVSKPDRSGNATKFVDFGQDTGGRHPGTLYLVNNTLVAGYSGNEFIQVTSADSRVVATNNIFYGSNKIVGVNYGSAAGANNWVATAASVPAGFTGSVRGTVPGFADAAGRDYRLTTSAGARDLGLNAPTAVDGSGSTISAVPQYQYVSHLAGTPRPSDGRLDLGAFEAPGASPPELSVGDARVTEGNAGSVEASFAVTLSKASSSPVTVSFATADGSATAGSDYSATSGTLTIAAGQTSGTIRVPVLGDGRVESDETFTLSLSGPSGAVLSRGVATATIVDDDAAAPAPGTLRYDFGVAGSPTAAGYTAVSPSSAYSAATGHGWSAGAIAGVDRGAGDALTRDLNYMLDGTFSIDLASGTYDVTVTMGDASYPQDQMALALEGVGVGVVSTSAGEFARRTYRVTVSDGRLTLRLWDLGGSAAYAVINALEVAAVSADPPPPPPPPPPVSPAGTLRYDFGPSGSLTAAGYTAVSPSSVYTPATGHGWSAGAIAATDRGIGDALTRDLAYTLDGTFGVDLASGQYDVTVTLGDASYAQDQMALALEGSRVAVVSTSAGEFARRTYRVTVSDGQLTLRLHDLGGSAAYAVINALEVAAVAAGNLRAGMLSALPTARDGEEIGADDSRRAAGDGMMTVLSGAAAPPVDRFTPLTRPASPRLARSEPWQRLASPVPASSRSRPDSSG